MEKFTWYNPTRLYFGKDQIAKLRDELKNYHKILFVYGGGSIKKYGLYEQVVDIFNEERKFYLELSGVEPNPKIGTVREGIRLAKQHNLDLVLAVGGGSTIDTAKAIAVGAVSEHDILDLLLNKYVQKEGLDIGVILTLSATGSEMNPRCVISDDEKKLKLGIGNWEVNATYPKFSICDPSYTLTVPKNQTINGIVDIISHVLEQYFNRNENSVLGDELAESLIKTMIDIGPKLIKDLHNYSLRETMMICGTMAWNGILRGLTNNGDWSCHQIEHALSAVYDIPHGEGLAIITPVWMRFCANKDPKKFVRFATKIFNISVNGKSDKEIALEGIEAYSKFLHELGAPNSMKYYQIEEYNIEELTNKTMLGRKTIGQYIPLSSEDVKEILSKVF
ncbi:MAG TPA: iron-containing alcohol dehydrogenase [Haloplasmataceae bacterium]